MTPETRLGWESAPKKNPTPPPRTVDNIPTYGPRISPISGAITAAAVTFLPGKPIMGEIGRKPKTTYRAVKQTVRARSFAEGFLLCAIVALLSQICGKLII
jgi:hypothetical protein